MKHEGRACTVGDRRLLTDHARPEWWGKEIEVLEIGGEGETDTFLRVRIGVNEFTAVRASDTRPMLPQWEAREPVRTLAGTLGRVDCHRNVTHYTDGTPCEPYQMVTLKVCRKGNLVSEEHPASALVRLNRVEVAAALPVAYVAFTDCPGRVQLQNLIQRAREYALVHSEQPDAVDLGPVDYDPKGREVH